MTGLSLPAAAQPLISINGAKTKRVNIELLNRSTFENPLQLGSQVDADEVHLN